MSRRRELWRRNRLYVVAVLEDDGDLVFEGQDLNGWLGYAEYEYWVRCPAVDVPRVVDALGGAPGDDVLALLAEHADELVMRGEHAWLRSLGITPGIETHSSD